MDVFSSKSWSIALWQKAPDFSTKLTSRFWNMGREGLHWILARKCLLIKTYRTFNSDFKSVVQTVQTAVSILNTINHFVATNKCLTYFGYCIGILVWLTSLMWKTIPYILFNSKVNSEQWHHNRSCTTKQKPFQWKSWWTKYKWDYMWWLNGNQDFWLYGTPGQHS